MNGYLFCIFTFCDPNIFCLQPCMAYVERTAKRRKLRKGTSGYRSVNYVVPTTCHTKRLFSKAKSVLSSDRANLHPKTLETIVYLKLNNNYWDAHDVEKSNK